MPDLPVRCDLSQLRREGDDPDAVARSYGFPTWRRLELEVERRRLLNERDLSGLRSLFAEHPELVTERMEHWCDHRLGATPLGYTAMLRFDAERLGLPPVTDGTAEVARMLISGGARIEGDPGETETPLMTAASYGDVDVARVLVEAGADLDAKAAANAGGVPGGSALLHAAVFGFTDVVDLLAASGARIDGIVEAAAVGKIESFLTDETPAEHKVRALTMAAGHGRVDVIRQLLAAGTPVDAVDGWGYTALRAATENGRDAAVSVVLEAGAQLIGEDGGGGPPA
jgi:hypothetical protein